MSDLLDKTNFDLNICRKIIALVLEKKTDSPLLQNIISKISRHCATVPS